MYVLYIQSIFNLCTLTSCPWCLAVHVWISSSSFDSKGLLKRFSVNIKIEPWKTPNLLSPFTWFRTLHTGCLKKNVVSWKKSHNYPQTHPKCKCWGCIGKFRIFATRWALRFSKLKKKWLRKWSLKLPTPLQKSAEFTAHIMHSFDDPLHFHDLQWKQNLFHTLVEGKVKVVLYPWPVYQVQGP